MLKLLAALPLLALPAFAQQTDSGTIPFRAPNFIHKTPIITTRTIALPQACPIGIAAHPGGLPQVLSVASLEDTANPGKPHTRTGVHVTLSSDTGTMTHVTIAVDYHPYAEGIQPVELRSARPTPTQQQTFELTAQDATTLQRNLLVFGSVDIERIRVLAVTYTDGTTWQAPAPATCSVRPSHYLLTATR